MACPKTWMDRLRWQSSLAGALLSLSGSVMAQAPAGELPARSKVARSNAAAVARAQAPEADGPAMSAPAGMVRLAGKMRPTHQPVAYQVPAVNCPPEALQSCPPIPREPMAGPYPYAAGVPFITAALQPSPHHYPDEYLCDGGDREWPVHYGEDVRLGLDTEDTIAEFQNHHGKEATTKSNRVCVYSPRFAAVRSVSLPYEEGTFREVAGVDHAGYGSEVRTRLAANQGNRNVALGGMQMRSRASGLESERLATDLQQRQRPLLNDKIQNTFQDVNFFQSGTFENSDLAFLNLGIAAAQLWSREQTPIIQGKTETARTGLSEVRATSLTVIEHDDNPGVLRIVKVADKQAAEVGDVITFTIRYDNQGPNPVSSVRIIDNLTPRLAYVDDSATCDTKGRLMVEDNGEGSQILIWELEEPVAPKSGGKVTFQARVR